MLALLLAGPLWLQVGGGSTTLFGDAEPRGGLIISGNLVARAGYWFSDRVALTGRARSVMGYVESLNIDGPPDPPDTTGPIAIALGGGGVRLSPWGGSFVELGVEGGSMGWTEWHPVIGGSLSFGWTWWTGSIRWGIEAFLMGAGWDENGYGGTGFSLVFGGGRPGDLTQKNSPD